MLRHCIDQLQNTTGKTNSIFLEARNDHTGGGKIYNVFSCFSLNKFLIRETPEERLRSILLYVFHNHENNFSRSFFSSLSFFLVFWHMFFTKKSFIMVCRNNNVSEWKIGILLSGWRFFFFMGSAHLGIHYKFENYRSISYSIINLATNN